MNAAQVGCTRHGVVTGLVRRPRRRPPPRPLGTAEVQRRWTSWATADYRLADLAEKRLVTEGFTRPMPALRKAMGATKTPRFAAARPAARAGPGTRAIVAPSVHAGDDQRRMRAILGRGSPSRPATRFSTRDRTAASSWGGPGRPRRRPCPRRPRSARPRWRPAEGADVQLHLPQRAVLGRDRPDLKDGNLILQQHLPTTPSGSTREGSHPAARRLNGACRRRHEPSSTATSTSTPGHAGINHRSETLAQH